MYFVVVSVTDVAVLMTPFNIKIIRWLNIKVISTEDAVDELIRWVENDHPSDGEDFDEDENNLDMDGSDDDASNINDNIDHDADVSDGYVL